MTLVTLVTLVMHPNRYTHKVDCYLHLKYACITYFTQLYRASFTMEELQCMHVLHEVPPVNVVLQNFAMYV